MSEWKRNNAWRQSSILRSDTVSELGLQNSYFTANFLYIVVSHDCDIAQPINNEPFLEIICASRIPQLDGTYTNAKSPRRLHIEFFCQGCAVNLELMATSKSTLDKKALIEQIPDERFKILPRELKILQSWLAARYRRTALPNAFEERLNCAKLGESIAKIVKPLNKHLIALFIDLDDGQNIERSQTDTYNVRLNLLYSTDEDPILAETAVKESCKKISDAFNRAKAKLESKGFGDIELLSCEAYADTVMTYAHTQVLSKWNLDYISLRSEPQIDVLD